MGGEGCREGKERASAQLGWSACQIILGGIAKTFSLCRALQEVRPPWPRSSRALTRLDTWDIRRCSYTCSEASIIYFIASGQSALRRQVACRARDHVGALPKGSVWPCFVAWRANCAFQFLNGGRSIAHPPMCHQHSFFFHPRRSKTCCSLPTSGRMW